MKPKQGTCLVVVDREKEVDLEGMPENIRTVAAGFDPSKLLAAIDELSNA
jgi:hypothetical protein